MNRLTKKVVRAIKRGEDLNTLAKKYPRSLNKALRWLMYKQNKWKAPEPWRPFD